MGNQTKYETSEDVEKDDPDAKKLFDPLKLEEEITGNFKLILNFANFCDILCI